jgi:hypothetical protein
MIFGLARFCGSLFCFRNQLVRLLNLFDFLRIHEVTDLCFTCVWHPWTMFDIGDPRCSVLYKNSRNTSTERHKAETEASRNSSQTDSRAEKTRPPLSLSTAEEFKARYHRIKARQGSGRAVVAVAHKLVRTMYSCPQNSKALSGTSSATTERSAAHA